MAAEAAARVVPMEAVHGAQGAWDCMWGLVRPLRACKSLCERSSSMSFICEVKRAGCIVWIRWVKAGLVAQAVMWRPSCVAYRHGWAQLGVVLVVHLERGTVSVTAAVERRFSLLDHVHLARVR